ncbi:SchA/CurD-like domain-containing protein [Salinispora oceanensis]|uniref:SchA/CurD-like domain-containing protein n=1 Tax=Salinispora oceanensis TaxID=1050199 RepID=UPI000378DA9A|nr:SchA/CurD-like domain-containing protein [Salinispora oceanensis]
MPFAGISYRVKPGHEDRIAEIFSPENFRRVDSPVLRDPDGEEIGFLLCTGLFIAEDTIVRVIQHEGGAVADIRRHMSVQEGVREAERELMPYLAAPRDTETPEGFMAHFDRSLMNVLDLNQVDNRPAAGLVALRYRIRPEAADELPGALAAIPTFTRLAPPVAGEAGEGSIVCTFLLVKEDVVVRVVQYDSREESNVTAFLRALPLAVVTDAWLTPYLADAPATWDLASHLARHQMRCVTHLSAAVLN